MQFFTLDWWFGLQGGAREFDNEDPMPRFREHLDAIRERLPRALLELHETVSLHDANLRILVYASQDNALTLVFDGYDGNGGFRRLTLRYSDVASFKSTDDPGRGLSGPPGYGDLGYDEPDIMPDGRIVHRLLFSSGIEMQVIFRELELSWKDGK
jgi:hypothetical protein